MQTIVFSYEWRMEWDMDDDAKERIKEVNRMIYETSIKHEILRAKEKGLREISVYFVTLDVYSFSRFLWSLGFRTKVDKNILTISWS